MAHKDLLLIDGRNFVYRHAYTRGNLYSGKRPTGAIFGVLSGLIRLNRHFPNAYIVFCWDGIDAQNSWRHKLASDYKGTRNKPKGEVPKEVQEIRYQIPIITEFVGKFGFKSFSVPRLEADDLIGILATSLRDDFNKVIIYSTDKDFYQLIKGNVCVVRDLDKKKECEEVTPAEVKKRWGVLPNHWLRYRALIGEKTDNIQKPIPKVGPKTAIKMLKAGVDPSKDIPHPDYKAHWSKVRICYKLTKIVRKVNDDRLPSISKKQLKKIVLLCKGTELSRSATSKSKKNYKWYMTFLAEYELQDIMERRHALWQIM